MLTSNVKINFVMLSIMIVSTQHQLYSAWQGITLPVPKFTQSQQTFPKTPAYSAQMHRNFRRTTVTPPPYQPNNLNCNDVTQAANLARANICQEQTQQNQSQNQCPCCINQCYCCQYPEGQHQQYWLDWYMQNQSNPYAHTWLTKYQQIAKKHNDMISLAIYVKVGPLNFKK